MINKKNQDYLEIVPEVNLAFANLLGLKEKEYQASFKFAYGLNKKLLEVPMFPREIQTIFSRIPVTTCLYSRDELMFHLDWNWLMLVLGQVAEDKGGTVCALMTRLVDITEGSNEIWDIFQALAYYLEL